MKKLGRVFKEAFNNLAIKKFKKGIFGITEQENKMIVDDYLEYRSNAPHPISTFNEYLAFNTLFSLGSKEGVKK